MFCKTNRISIAEPFLTYEEERQLQATFLSVKEKLEGSVKPRHFLAYTNRAGETAHALVAIHSNWDKGTIPLEPVKRPREKKAIIIGSSVSFCDCIEYSEAHAWALDVRLRKDTLG